MALRISRVNQKGFLILNVDFVRKNMIFVPIYLIDIEYEIVKSKVIFHINRSPSQKVSHHFFNAHDIC